MPHLALCFLFIATATLSAATYDIRNYGAVGDGKADDTSAVQAAIDACTETGGTVFFPPGDYLTGMVEVKSNVTVHLVNTATWYGIPDPGRYPPVPVNDRRVFIYAHSAENIRFEGQGTIHGNGQNHDAFVPEKGHLKKTIRPYGFLLWECRNVSFDGLRLRNSAFWMLRLDQCDDVMIRNLDLVNHSNFNNDGIDIVDCHRVTVSDCVIDAEDDALCLKSEWERGCLDVVVSNCILSSAATAIKMGTASFGAFRRITVSNCVVRPSRFEETMHPSERPRGLSAIDLISTDGATLSQVSISNLEIEGTETAFFIRLGNRHRNYTGTAEGEGKHEKPGAIHDVTLSNIRARNIGKVAASVSGYPGAYVERITLSHIDIALNERGLETDTTTKVPENADWYPFARMFRHNLPASGLFLRHVKDVQIDHFTIRPLPEKPRPDFHLEEVIGAHLGQVQTRHPDRVEPKVISRNTAGLTGVSIDPGR